MPKDVDQLKLREMTSDFAEESSEGGSDTSSVQKLSLSAIVGTLCSVSKEKGKGKGKKGQWTHGSPVGGHIAECGGQSPAAAWRNRKSHRKAQEGRQRQRQKWRKGQRQRKRPQVLRVRRDCASRKVVPQRRMG